ncbi:MAG: GDP-mannose 4,6-dehydratase [Chthoniobacterales bacterium]
MKRALIVGAAGQDGRLLSRAAEERGDVVARIGRRTGEGITALDLLDSAAVVRAVAEFAPDEIYYLAAFHQSSEERERLSPVDLWRRSFETHVDGAINFLEAIRTSAPRARFFYAASCLLFGANAPSPQNEQTPFSPDTVYGITKAAGAECCRFYRREHNVFAAVGILYNHESSLRSPSFLSQKVVRAALEIKAGQRSELILGDLSSETDWGYAPDYIDAMMRILQAKRADDFVIATGIPHTVQDFVECAFAEVGLDWRQFVREEKSMLKAPRGRLIGDASKLKRETGWIPSVSFREMVSRLLKECRP